MNNDRRWYIIQTYSGFENSVKEDLERRIETMGQQDYIFNVLIPEEEYEDEKKDGTKVIKKRKMFPSYVFVEMIVTEKSWFIVRNTPKVTGFLGSSGGGTKPVPLTPEEYIPILRNAGVSLETQLNFKVGDTVQVMVGTFAGQEVVVEAIDHENQMVTVLVEFFGRQTPQDLHFDEVKALN